MPIKLHSLRLQLQVSFEVPVEEVFDAHATSHVTYEVGDEHHPREKSSLVLFGVEMTVLKLGLNLGVVGRAIV